MQPTIHKFLEYKLLNYSILDSTNIEAKTLINKNQNPNNFVIIAEHQTSGRGRNGNDWASEQGNLFCSIIIKLPDSAQQFSFITALALANILQGIYNLNPQIKWPNDIKIDGKKISGILLEKHKEYLIIGVGVNIIESPSYLKIFATSLKEGGVDSNSETFLEHFLIEFTKIKKQYEKQGFLEIKDEINKKLFHKNKIVTLNYINKETTGKIIEVNDSGNLVLQTENGYEEYNAGEILNI